jgi:hypothetical protein
MRDDQIESCNQSIYACCARMVDSQETKSWRLNMIHDSMQVPSVRLVSFLLSGLDPIAVVFCSVAGCSCRIGEAAVLTHEILTHAVCRLASLVLPVLLSAHEYKKSTQKIRSNIK